MFPVVPPSTAPDTTDVRLRCRFAVWLWDVSGRLVPTGAAVAGPGQGLLFSGTATMEMNPRGTAIRGRDGVAVRKPFVQAAGTISHQRHWPADICGAELPASSTPHLTDTAHG